MNAEMAIALPGQPALNDRLLVVEGLTKSYATRNGTVPAIGSISFDVREGEFVSIVGASGSGKTTLMMCIAGLLSTSGGVVQLAGSAIDGPPEQVAVVFQDYSRSLFPWLTCGKNVALPLKGRGHSRSETAEIVRSSLAAVGLDGVESMYPWQLSGGMQQRVAIARGLARSPRVLIMDEPFASVDAQTRANLEDLLLDVWSRLRMTILFVTHDIDEAVYLSDRVLVLSQSPSTVAAEVEIPLPRGRDQLATKEEPLFAALRHDIFTRVMSSAKRELIVQ